MLAKRSVVEIVHEILQVDGRKKTHIMYKTALTHPQMVRYLNVLTERGLIAKNSDGNGGEVYKVTERGRDLSRHLDVVIGYLGLGDESV